MKGALFILFRLILPVCLGLIMLGLSVEGLAHLTGWPHWAAFLVVILLFPTGVPIVALTAYDLIAVYHVAWYWVALGILGPAALALLVVLAVTMLEKA